MPSWRFPTVAKHVLILWLHDCCCCCCCCWTLNRGRQWNQERGIFSSFIFHFQQSSPLESRWMRWDSKHKKKHECTSLVSHCLNPGFNLDLLTWQTWRWTSRRKVELWDRLFFTPFPERVCKLKNNLFWWHHGTTQMENRSFAIKSAIYKALNRTVNGLSNAWKASTVDGNQ